MSSSDIELLQRYRAAAVVLAGLPVDVARYGAADEATLLEVNRLFADAQRVLGAAGAVIAGEIAHRSAPQLGSQGLAQRTGFRTPEEFVRATTRSTKREAITAVNAGRLVHEERRAARSARLIQKPDGGGVLVWQMDPETFALVKEVCDRVTSPRRGGPRFVNAGDRAVAERISADARTTEQYLSDSILELLRLSTGANPRFLLGSGAPVVRVTVTKRARDARQGFGRIEGQPGPVSIETIERLACSGDTVEVGFAGDGQPLDVGREQRFYTRAQRIALAVRDGGCRWPGCERPPSWTEAHHTRYWSRDRGKTDVGDGILLCRHHHLLVHNNAWEIGHNGAEYWLIPPPNIDPKQKRVPMPSHSPAMRDLAREAAVDRGDPEHEAAVDRVFV